MIQLDKVKALSTDNFVKYVESELRRHVFHRVMDTSRSGRRLLEGPEQKPTPRSDRVGERPERDHGLHGPHRDPNSATSQFFINTVDNAMLDYANDFKPGYAVSARWSRARDGRQDPQGEGAADARIRGSRWSLSCSRRPSASSRATSRPHRRSRRTAHARELTTSIVPSSSVDRTRRPSPPRTS